MKTGSVLSLSVLAAAIVPLLLLATGCDAREKVIANPVFTEDGANVPDGDGDQGTDPDSDNGSGDRCQVPQGELSGVVVVQKQLETPQSFEPEILWQWTGPREGRESFVTPLVANLTDDDRNGTIDLCDVPDVVVVGWNPQTGFERGNIYVLSGADGTIHFSIETPVSYHLTPALGDIDGDGLVEIVSASPGERGGHLLAFEHDGTLKWTSSERWPNSSGAAVALADLDNDGDVEILAGDRVFDHNGALLWCAAPQDDAMYSAAATAADLDGDGDLEVILGHAAYHHDGTAYYRKKSIAWGYPQVGDLDADGDPEILVTNPDGLTLLEHTGETIYKNLTPAGARAALANWLRPAAIHDFDGDRKAEFAVSPKNSYTIYEGDGRVHWSVEVSGENGAAGGTAFDFLGNGVAQAVFADNRNTYIFDQDGAALLRLPRASLTVTEYPVVADVNGDGSADIIVVSNHNPDEPTVQPTVQVIHEKHNRWAPARRIWNQHTYHVTNVIEDGTIPRFEPPNWEVYNTFRTQVPIRVVIVDEDLIVE